MLIDFRNDGHILPKHVQIGIFLKPKDLEF